MSSRRRRRGAAGLRGASLNNALSIVVLPAPFRPINTIFSPRLTMASKPAMTFSFPNDFFSPLNSSAIFA